MLGAILVFLAAATALPLLAQTNAPPVNRFLLIIETSHAMQRRSDGTLRTVNDLIASRMRGQLRLNDSIGVWTFNETLYTGKLPLQEWSEGERTAIASKLFDFLQEQKYEKEGRLDKLMPALLKVVKNSRFITVVLISDGSAEFHGTPFDEQINRLYKQWTAQQQKARMPFVTVLRAQRGQLTNYSVTPAPWPADIPPLPADLVQPKAPPSLPVVSAPKPAPPPMAPPLIISGRKPATAAVVLPTTNSSLAMQTSSSGTNAGPGGQVAENKPPDTATTAPAPTVPAQRLAEPSPGSTTPASLPPPPVTQTLATSSESKSAAKPSQEPPPSATPTTEPKSPPVASSSPANKLDEQPTTQRSDAPPAADIATAPAAPANSLAKVIGLGLLFAVSVAAVTVWVWRRRRRPPAHVSLITRSLDRDQH